MDATYNFGFELTQERTAKSASPNRFLNQHTLERISTGISLVVLSLGFPIFGILIMVNQRQADLSDLSNHSSLAPLGGIVSILVGAAFLIGSCLHWNRCARFRKQLAIKK